MDRVLEEIKDIRASQGFLCILLFLNLFFGSCCSYGPDRELRQQVKNLQSTVNRMDTRQTLTIMNTVPEKTATQIMDATRGVE